MTANQSRGARRNLISMQGSNLSSSLERRRSTRSPWLNGSYLNVRDGHVVQPLMQAQPVPVYFVQG